MLHPSLLYNRGHKDVLLTPSATSARLCQPCLILSRWKLAIQLFIHMQILIGPMYMHIGWCITWYTGSLLLYSSLFSIAHHPHVFLDVK